MSGNALRIRKRALFLSITFLVAVVCIFLSGCNNGSNLAEIESDTEKVVMISSGSTVTFTVGSHSLALKSDGTVWGWGRNKYGQLGDDTTESSITPVQVLSLTDVIEISAGASYSLALKSDGTVWAWGDNQYGKLGHGIKVNNEYAPVQVVGLTDVVAISAGATHSLVVRADGTVWGWGLKNSGALGDGTTPHINEYSNKPVQAVGLVDVVAVSAGGRGYSLAVKSDGTVWAWGNNFDGQLGIGTSGWGKDLSKNKPIQVVGLTEVVAVSAGDSHSLALKSDGTVWAWGPNGHGQIGTGSTETELLPVQVLSLTDVIEISAGASYSLAVKSDGTVWAWGSNTYGELGDGTKAQRRIPVQALTLSEVIGISASNFAPGKNSLAVKEDGTVWEWGYNYVPERYVERLTPVQVQVTGLR